MVGEEKGRDQPSMVGRFSGDRGRQTLLAVLAETPLFRNISGLDVLVTASQVREIKKGIVLIEQGAADDNLYVVLSGQFNIFINGRQVAVRGAGSHLGEMAVLDRTARRSASVIANADSVVLEWPHEKFVEFANSNPSAWRHIGVELSRRLSERTAFIKAPRPEPVLFIGCSTEALEIAREVQVGFTQDKFVVEVWTDGIFNPSRTPIEDLSALVRRVDFGLLVLTPDDHVSVRGEAEKQPRDNVIYELGLLTGAVGRERTFMLLPRDTDLKLPSDLLGVNPLEYSMGSGSLASRLGPPCHQLRIKIRELGPL